MGHCNLRTAKDHTLYKLIDYLNLREKINLMCLLTASKQVAKKPLDPDAALFAPNVELINNEDQSSQEENANIKSDNKLDNTTTQQ